MILKNSIKFFKIKMGAEQSQLYDSANLSGSGLLQKNQIKFKINGQEHIVETENSIKFTPDTVLVDYIRDEAGLTGCKYMCREGGCGACVVTVKSYDPTTKQDLVRGVNACLAPLFGCDGWDITTIEFLGNKATGYHQIQQRIVNFSGTQCGFCTPGMVMNMYSLMESKKNLKASDIEDNFDGNICRCTGYRPILDAFKSMAVDADENLKRKCARYEDMNPCKGCPCADKKKDCEIEVGIDMVHIEQDIEDAIDQIDPMTDSENPKSAKIHLHSAGAEWVKANTLANVFEALNAFSRAQLKPRIVAGNTSRGVYKQDGPWSGFIDVKSVPILSRIAIDGSTGITLGSTVTLARTIEFLQRNSKREGMAFFAGQMAKHIGRVANAPVRNAATLGGNLMVKHAHREFPSDIFLLFETLSAKIVIATGPNPNQFKTHTLTEFLEMSMDGKVIISLNIPAFKGPSHFRSFKISRRYQNAHAYVNAGFMLKVDPKNNFAIMGRPTIVFGGINPTFVHASKTEEFLTGKSLDGNALQGALEILDKELQPDHHLPDADPEYRRGLAMSLFYKVILGIMQNKVNDRIKSGAGEIERRLITGKHSYDNYKEEWPLYQPMTKIEGPFQASGEAQYTNDVGHFPRELQGAIVHSELANASIKSIDASKALAMPGVVSFLSAKDIPGDNNYMVKAFGPAEREEIFASKKVQYGGQAIGMILAETREIAYKAVNLVQVTYEDIQKPILNLVDALKKAEAEGKSSDQLIYKSEKTENLLKVTQSKHNLKGQFQIGGQYHFQMETQIAICVPREGGIECFSSTQWVDQIQATIAAVLKIPNNQVYVQVKRVGGAFGSKITKAAYTAGACAIGAWITQRPVRLALAMESNMEMIGGRLPYLIKYEVGFDDSGKIESLKSDLFCDTGFSPNEPTSFLALLTMQSCYASNGWTINAGAATTNTPSNTYCRSPGFVQGTSTMEYILEHISDFLKKDPVDIRVANLIKEGDAIFGVDGAKFEGENKIPMMLQEIKESGEYEERKKFVENFNRNNRWKKRGISLLPMRWPVHYFVQGFSCFIAIHHVDGTVSISHGGIESGQGMNTKVGQVVAHQLKIPFEKVKFRPTDNFVTCNSFLTGGSTTSENVAFAAVQACNTLLERLKPIRAKMENPTWEALIAEAHANFVELNATGTVSHKDALKGYDVWVVDITEVEVDILTGEYKIVRCDIIEDTGKSLSPEVDIGQIEGAVVMGHGLWTSEKHVHNPTTGRLLTNRTWDYKPPLPRDIPEDFRVQLLKNSSNSNGVLSSKATAEPPLCITIAVLFAIKQAIDSARADAGSKEPYQIDAPITPEDIFRYSLTGKSQLTL